MSTPDSKTVNRSRFPVASFLIILWMLSNAWIPCYGQLIYQQIRPLPAGDIGGVVVTDPTLGSAPIGQLIEGSDGRLYGTASRSDFLAPGAVFRVNKDGSGYSALWKFGVVTNDGLNSWGGLVEGTDGSLFGTTYSGGTNNLGTVFKLTSAGGDGYTNKILKSFTGLNGDGANPTCKLIIGIDGWLYGTTYNGGSNNVGIVFKMQTNGANFTV